MVIKGLDIHREKVVRKKEREHNADTTEKKEERSSPDY